MCSHRAVLDELRTLWEKKLEESGTLTDRGTVVTTRGYEYCPKSARLSVLQLMHVTPFLSRHGSGWLKTAVPLALPLQQGPPRHTNLSLKPLVQLGFFMQESSALIAREATI